MSGMMLCQHCDAFVSTANDAPRCTCCGERSCSRCLGKEKHTQIKPEKETTMGDKQVINELAEQAKKVGRQQTDYDEAWDAEHRARAELLQAVLDSVRPALRAICNRVVIKGTSSAAGSTTDAALWRGLLVSSEPSGGGPKVVPIAGDRHRGRYAGSDLLLNDEGVLVEIVYEGTYSNVKGEISSWEGKWCPLTCRHAITEYSADKIIDRLTTALLDSAKGASPMRTAMLLSRAEHLRAVTVMLKSVSK